MLNDKLAFHQRVIFTGLCRMTKDRTLIISAYSYWMNTLSTKAFDVASVVDELTEYLGLGGDEKRSLMVALHAASNKLLEDLRPVPPVVSQAADSGVSNTAKREKQEEIEIRTPHFVITNAYCQEFVQRVRKLGVNEFTELKNIIVEEGLGGLNEANQQAILQWGSDGLSDLNLPEDISANECRHIAHELYLLATEVAGPIRADEIVNAVISSTLSLEEAEKFDPRSLL